MSVSGPVIQALREATASERLTLEEEHENQASWRAAGDKLTYIVCRPLEASDACDGCDEERHSGHPEAGAAVRAGKVDGPERMVGDVNFFLHLWNGDSVDGDGSDTAQARHYVGEVDIMIAAEAYRGQGMGRATVLTFLYYILHHLDGILRECDGHLPGQQRQQQKGQTNEEGGIQLRLLMAKINEENSKSIALFKSLGFKQDGDADYFGEVKLILWDRDFDRIRSNPPDDYVELLYVRKDKDCGSPRTDGSL